jgi:hypothetical protein
VQSIPREHEEQVLAVAEEIDRVEDQIRTLVRGGMTLVQARRELGYHKLQSKR